MAKAPKKKVGGSRNDARQNGKAAKQNPGSKVTGSKSVPMSPIDLVLMGKGLYQKVENRAHDEKLKAKSSANKKKPRRIRDED